MRAIVLLQASSLSNLQQQRSQIEDLLALDGVAGFSIRVPGNVLNPSKGVWDLSTLNLARDIAAGRELQTRSMGGRWAPAHARGYSMVYDGTKLPGEQFTLPKGTVIPMCFERTGTRNQVYWGWCTQMFDKLVTFAKTVPNCKVQHFFWPGLTWAEIAVIGQMSRMPGFNFNTVVQFHVDLMKAAHTKWLKDVEFALSGHVVDPYRSIFGTLLTQAKTSNRHIINRNDIRDITNLDGIKYPPRHAFQMWGTQTDYNFPWMLDKAQEVVNGYERADYFEFYPGNFGSSVLRTELARRFS